MPYYARHMPVVFTRLEPRQPVQADRHDPVSLKDSVPVTLWVYDMTGQRIRRLVQEEQQAGYHKLEWDGRDASGSQVATGVYLYELRAGRFRSVRKMVLLK